MLAGNLLLIAGMVMTSVGTFKYSIALGYVVLGLWFFVLAILQYIAAVSREREQKTEKMTFGRGVH